MSDNKIKLTVVALSGAAALALGACGTATTAPPATVAPAPAPTSTSWTLEKCQTASQADWVLNCKQFGEVSPAQAEADAKVRAENEARQKANDEAKAAAKVKADAEAAAAAKAAQDKAAAAKATLPATFPKKWFVHGGGLEIKSDGTARAYGHGSCGKPGDWCNEVMVMKVLPVDGKTVKLVVTDTYAEVGKTRYPAASDATPKGYYYTLAVQKDGIGLTKLFKPSGNEVTATAGNGLGNPWLCSEGSSNKDGRCGA